MSALESHDENVGAGPLRYAPRRTRFPQDDGTIKPILERLNRGESGELAQAGGLAAPPSFLQASRRAPKFDRRLIAASGVTAGLTTGLAILVIAWFWSSPNESSRPEAAALDSKPVQTVSVKQDARIPEPAKAEPALDKADTSAAEQGSSTVAEKPKPRSDDPGAPKDLLTLWSGVPAESAAQAPNPPPQASNPPPVEPAASAAEETDGSAPSPEESHHRMAASRHHHSRRAHVRHRTRQTARPAPRAQTAVQDAPATEAAAQPAASNPLQSTLQSVFGHPVPSGQNPGMTSY